LTVVVDIILLFYSVGFPLNWQNPFWSYMVWFTFYIERKGVWLR